MPENLDCKLPGLVLQPDHLDPPYDRVPWLDVLCETVKFEEWTAFDDLVSQTCDEIDQIGHTLECPELFLSVARDYFVYTSFFDDGGNCNPSSRRVYVRVVEGCTSNSLQLGLNQNVMIAVERAVQRLHGTKRVWMRNRRVLLENPKELSTNIRWGEDKETGTKPLVWLPKERTPDFTLMKFSISPMVGKPICAFAVHGPCYDILASLTPRSTRWGKKSEVLQELEQGYSQVSRISAKELCDRYQALFNKGPVTDNGKRGNHDSDLTNAALLPVARVVSFALSVAGGCAFLFNNEYGVALEIVRNDNDENVHVHVSRPFHRGEDKAPPLAMMALSIYCLKRVEGDKSLSSFIKRMADKIDQASRGNRSVLSRTLDGSTQAQWKTGSGEDLTTSGDTLDIREAHSLERMDILGSGNSGVVFEAVWKGRRVAIKEWNGISKEGLHSLRNEVSIYISISQKCPHLLGSVLPNVLLAWKGSARTDCDAEEPLLATEIVGEPIFRDREECLFIGSQQMRRRLSGIEEREICEEALEGLKRLQDAGIHHKSIHLRNLRVKRDEEVDDAGASGRWKIWWLDLGRAELHNLASDSFHLQWDLKCCRDMFLTREEV